MQRINGATGPKVRADWLLLLTLLAWFGIGHAASICAVVKIEIRQELTFERQGFEAHLRINNELETLALEDLAVNVVFEDADGNPVVASFDPNNTDAQFFLRIRSMDGVNAVDGTGVVHPASSADIRWLIVPAPGAGGNVPSGKLYFVGAQVGYSLGGEAMQTEVSPDYIYVRPMPLLSLDYFLTEDVFADDPKTPQIEPIEPFTLGVRVRNNGQGAASNVRIESAQPQIVENEQGLLIDFRIIGSSINEEPATPSLLVNLDNIEPGGTSMARWVMETTLSGQFVDFHAEFSHADELGGTLTSLIENVNSHFLIRDVLVDLPGRDSVRDFLASDGDSKRVYESSGLDTEVLDQSGLAQRTELNNGREQISFPETAGFVYVQLPDPYRGTREVAVAYRSDAKAIRPENVWFSKKRNRDNDTWEYYFNLFDVNSTGNYQLVLQNAITEPGPPTLQFIAPKRTYEGARLGFIVEASDPNGTLPHIGAEPLPAGAGLEDESNSPVLAQYVFDWQVATGQAQVAPDGSYIPYQVTFTASDGVLESSQQVEILVCPAWDTDCDRMHDAWELQHFGSLERDGSGDYDGDGISDLDEYLRAKDRKDKFSRLSTILMLMLDDNDKSGVSGVDTSPKAPSMSSIANQRTYEGARLDFIIEASDPNGTLPLITVDPLPAGAALLNQSSSSTLARYAFDWSVAVGQAQIAIDGTYMPYLLTFSASDDVLETTQVVEILVCPAWDTDCDRMGDAWELAHFGNLERDGTQDYDGDGVSDLDEYLNAQRVRPTWLLPIMLLLE